MKPEKDYLNSLITDVEDLADVFDHSDVDVAGAEISYLATKKYDWLGLHEGVAAKADIKAKRTKFSNKIRANCLFFNKFYYLDGRLVKVENFCEDRESPDVWYRTYYKDNKRYLYPCGSYAKNGCAYIYVTEYRDGKVYEEYMITGKQVKQIVFWRYRYPREGVAEVYYVNYVPKGEYPVLAEGKEVYDEATLERRTVDSYVWYQDRNKNEA